MGYLSFWGPGGALGTVKFWGKMKNFGIRGEIGKVGAFWLGVGSGLWSWVGILGARIVFFPAG